MQQSFWYSSSNLVVTDAFIRNFPVYTKKKRCNFFIFHEIILYGPDIPTFVTKLETFASLPATWQAENGMTCRHLTVDVRACTQIFRLPICVLK